MKTGKLSEAEIAQSTEIDELISAKKSARSKFLKHQRFQQKSGQYPPHYFAFLIPESLLSAALKNIPSYAGILIFRESSKKNFKWVFPQPSAQSRLAIRP